MSLRQFVRLSSQYNDDVTPKMYETRSRCCVQLIARVRLLRLQLAMRINTERARKYMLKYLNTYVETWPRLTFTQLLSGVSMKPCMMNLVLRLGLKFECPIDWFLATFNTWPWKRNDGYDLIWSSVSHSVVIHSRKEWREIPLTQREIHSKELE